MSGKTVANSYGVMGAPSVYIIDTTGEIVYSRAGFMIDEVLETLNGLFKN